VSGKYRSIFVKNHASLDKMSAEHPVTT